MSTCRLPLAATLSALAMTAMAADYTGGVRDVTPRSIQDNGRRIYLLGLVDIDGVKMNNTTDGNNSRSDMRSEGWGRAELGGRVVLDDRVEVGVTVGYVSQAGNNRPLGYDSHNPPPANVLNFPEANEANGYHSSGDMTLQDAYIHLPDFLGFRQLDVLVGRQMVANMNLRKGRAAWLYDSRSMNRPVTRWDGAQIKYNLSMLSMDIDAFAFRLPDDSSLFGGMADWKVIDKSEVSLFFTGSYTLQKDLILNDLTTAENLRTAYAGFDLDLGVFDFYGEFAMQRGDVGRNTGQTFHGWGANVGVDWRVIKDRSQEYVLGVQYEHLSGDDGSNPEQYNGFVNTWEATSDTYLVEHEKYTQISRMQVGNLSDWKVRMEYSVFSRMRMSAIWGRYQLVTPAPEASNSLGNEYDLTLSYDYTGNTRSDRSGGCTFTLFGGIFRPDAGYEDLQRARGVADAGTDMMWLAGLNILARF